MRARQFQLIEFTQFRGTSADKPIDTEARPESNSNPVIEPPSRPPVPPTPCPTVNGPRMVEFASIDRAGYCSDGCNERSLPRGRQGGRPRAQGRGPPGARGAHGGRAFEECGHDRRRAVAGLEKEIEFIRNFYRCFFFRILRCMRSSSRGTENLKLSSNISGSKI